MDLATAGVARILLGFGLLGATIGQCAQSSRRANRHGPIARSRFRPSRAVGSVDFRRRGDECYRGRTLGPECRAQLTRAATRAANSGIACAASVCRRTGGRTDRCHQETRQTAYSKNARRLAGVTLPDWPVWADQDSSRPIAGNRANANRLGSNREAAHSLRSPAPKPARARTQAIREMV